jgi:hypothetical protein
VLPGCTSAVSSARTTAWARSLEIKLEQDARDVGVWVVVASRYGSMREVAEAIAEELGRAHEVHVRDAAELENFQGGGRGRARQRDLPAGAGSSRPGG